MLMALLALLPLAASSSGLHASGERGAVQLGARLRPQFPALAQSVWGDKPLVYLDSGATSQKPSVVLDAMRAHLERDNANVHRGAHLLSVRSTESFEAARDKVAAFVNARRREEVVFTRGATEAINLVAKTWGVANLREGDEILLSVMEHHSNLVPWQQLAAASGAVLKFVPLNASECLDVAQLHSLVTPRTKLISMVHVSNTLGCVLPVGEVVAAARRVGARVLLDACQSVPHMPIDVAELGVDFLVASGHKMCAPTGIGFLWGRHELLSEMPPWMGGGEMIDDVYLDHSTYMPPPARFEAGTPPITQAVGLGAAVDYLTAVGMREVEAYEQHLGAYLYARLAQVPGLRLYGPDPSRGIPRAALCAFNSETVHASDLATFLDQDGIAVRAGHHCTQPLHRALGAAGSARASLYIYNTERDVDALIDSLTATLSLFAELSA